MSDAVPPLTSMPSATPPAPKVEPEPAEELGEPETGDRAPSPLPNMAPGPTPAMYPVVYSVVDPAGYAVNMGPAPPHMLPPGGATAYYIPAPAVYGFPGPPADGSSPGPGSTPYYVSPAGPGTPAAMATPDGTPLAAPPVFYAAAAPAWNPPGPAGGQQTVYYSTGPAPGSYGQWLGPACGCAVCRGSMATPHATMNLQPPPPPTPGPATAPQPLQQQPAAGSMGGDQGGGYPQPGPPGSPAAAANGAAAGSGTPLTGRQAGDGDMRRVLFPGAPKSRPVADDDSLPSPPASALSERERKKRKMGYLNNILYKTEMCRDYQQAGACPRGKSCQFAHGGAEVHHPRNHPLYKTAFCFDFKKDGQCPRGDACFHVHHSAEMRDKPNRTRGTRGPRFGRGGGGGGARSGPGTPKGGGGGTSPLVFTRSRPTGGGGGGSANSPATSGHSVAGSGSFSGEALPNPSDVKNTMRLLQRLSSENTAHLLKKLSEDDALRASPIRH